MMCNYGSSEYAQAFSRIGSLFGNVYIVNDDLEVQEIRTNSESGVIESIEINYNDTAVKIKEGGGLIAGHHSKDMLETLIKKKESVSVEVTQSISKCLRLTLISKLPILSSVESLGTFIIPPNTP